jgi:hypothetical protein
MLMAKTAIAVVMQRRSIRHRWSDTAWAAVSVTSDPGGLAPLNILSSTANCELYVVPGMSLELYPDENDGYFENWAAPEPKVFIMWRMHGERAMPVAASVSYGEGTRMLDSGENADGVAMPYDIHAWLTEYLREHYHPRPRRGREHG